MSQFAGRIDLHTAKSCLHKSCVTLTQILHTKCQFCAVTEGTCIFSGDTFVAAVIYCLSRGVDLQGAIRFGCRVAGAKCGVKGFKNLDSNITGFPE